MRRIILFSVLIVLISGVIVPNAFAEGVPTWVKNTAGWWAMDMISEVEFVNAIEFLISDGIIVISHTAIDNEIKSQKIPEWIKNNAGWWAEEQIPDSAFINGIEYLIENGIIQIKVELDESQVFLKKRGELIDFIWKGEGLPTRLPDSIEYGITDKNFNELKNLKKIDKIEVEMKHSVNSIAYLMHPSEQLHNDLIIYHGGHGHYLYDAEKQIRFFLDRGYTVLVFSMPVTGYNNEPTVIINNEKREIKTHDDFKFLDSEKFSGISYFVEPIFVSLNYLDEEYDYTNYQMIGISGGGWTTVIYPAIDQRISHSYSVAGSIPLEQRTNQRDLGDYESMHPELYKIASYVDLYTLSSIGNDREFTQIFLENDPCCYAANRLDFSYNDEVKNNIEKFGSGEFKIIILNENKHNISGTAAMEFFLDIDEKNIAYFNNSQERMKENDFSMIQLNKENQIPQDLDKTIFIGGDFTSSSIMYNDFSNFDMSDSNFWYSIIFFTDFSNTNFSNSDISYSIVCSPKIDNSLIHNADFSHSMIVDVDFSKSSLKNTKFDSTSCYNCNFEGIDIKEIKISKDYKEFTNFAGSNFRNSDFRDWEFERVDFSAKIFSGCLKSQEIIPISDLTGANFSGLDLKDVVFTRTPSSVPLESGRMNEIDFSFADLSLLNLTDMSLKNANFSGANLTGVNFTDADLENANFSGATLDDAILDCSNHEICN